ncbi:outer membrane receptor protein involved in Fe transport [Jejuia pallidilutea]|uniref:Outer membrane receptor protein involved in Fe transport n=1 Tax=Jejuia pallidilutea TaxID=504487 RepID=A0A362WYE4_9FLAO|nr:outer membrane beta-barrel family protein [Jejuia pallidilutea]PQV46859.1 outer membrane receptor protein involved in Fe transport [Jejuia pallidilutea]
MKVFRTINFSLLCFLCFVSLKGLSQEVTISGTVVEEVSGQPLAYATVVIADKATKQSITGAMTLEDGTFKVTTEASNFFIEVSFIGFQTKTITTYSINNENVDLGIITLTEDAEQLGEVLVEAEVSSSQFKLDKRVFNIGKDLSSTGASALEVLNNVPSVNVDIEGAISLRGSTGVQVLINGKPSILTEDGGALGSITADMIDRIEVITNPSAKYDAEGTSGIINIVIKKDERKGINGAFSLNTGIPDNNSFGLSLNKRSEKFNLFTQLGFGRRVYPRDSENINEDLDTGTSIVSVGEDLRVEKFYNITLGTDYYINPTSVITLSGNFAYEIEDQPSDINFKAIDASNNVTSEWNRSETTEATNPKWQYELVYKKDFADHEDHDLLLSATGNSFGKDLESLFQDTTISGTDRDNTQNTRTDYSDNTYTFKLDYTKPFSEIWTMETGAQYVINDIGNDFEVQNLVDGVFETDLGLTNNFEFDQKVLGAYLIGGYEYEKWGVKGGLRLEQTDLTTTLVTTNESNNQNYTNLFPSIHTSYKLSNAISLQAGYSARINRPGMRELNPFFNIRNNFNIRQGNPNLKPEFTDSYELTSIFDIGKTDLNFGIFHRFTTDVIERISVFEDNVNISMPENIGTNSTIGVEFNTKYSPAKWLTFNVDFNYNQFNRKGTFEATIFDFNGDEWSSKLMAKFKLPADIDLEAVGNHRSRVKTVQGIRSANTFLDIGVRKKILKDKGVINLSIRDVFKSRFFENFIAQGNSEAYSWSRRGRFVAIGFSYGFGKGEAMEYSGGKRR